MALKTKKSLKGSIDNVLGDLLGEDTVLPEKPVEPVPYNRDAPGVPQKLASSKPRGRSFQEDEDVNTLGGVAGGDAEVSDISDPDPQDLLQAIKDLDDMDADLFGLKKSPASDRRAAKGSRKEELPHNPKPAGKLAVREQDLKDPLARLLSDDEEGIVKNPPVTESKTASDKNPSTVRDPDKEDSWDDEVLTFGAYQPTLGSSEGRQSRRQSVRFLPEGGSDPKGELGSKWSPSAASSPIHPRRGGAEWLGLKDEDLDLLPPCPTQEAQGGDLVICTPPVSQRATPCLQPDPPQRLSSGTKLPAEGAMSPVKSSQAAKLEASKEEEEEEEDWLSHVLSQKKSQGLARAERTGAYKTIAGSAPSGSQLGASIQELEQAAATRTLGGAAAQEALATRPDAAGSPTSYSQPALALSAGDLKRRAASGDPFYDEPASHFPSSQEPPGLPVPVQSVVPESLVQNLLPSTGYHKPFLAAQAQLQSNTGPLQAELLQSQAQLAELETQVRKLELERAQHKMLLQSLQQQHQADLELIESAHRSRIKMLESSYQQREERLRRENEELSARYLSHCCEAEQARAELTAQHQRQLAAAEHEKDQHMERLRDLQWASILEMRKDHDEQLQRLKLLKDQEIDAVTSATSHTRSLNGIIEQMEKFSSSLNVLASRVEASHLTMAQERELGVRQQDKQLRVLQERLGQQQRDMEEERGRLQEVIGKMEAHLSEQSRLLEQERWRVNAERSKAESMQRALEEQRKVMVQQITMEREELERVKSALLEEQKSVMHKCGEEQRRLAVEWAEFSTQQKLSKERAEREMERALQVDTQREGTIISLAKERAELKVRASELRVKEKQLATEREAVERERQELQLEKENVKATALSLQLRAEEVEHLSEVASKKYKEGELALHKARQMQSEQQARLQVLQRQQERLRQQEEHVHQEHLSLAQQRLQLDHVRQDLPCCPSELSPRAQGPAHSSLRASSTYVAPALSSHQHSQLLASPGPAHLLAKLVLLKHTAEQDRDFLENEQFFLEALKKAPYNLPSHSA
ncbi:fas-binding factor 1 isoform X7 [Cavia porcellus]|uniref:fas-binding factor 1 isoform X7 n=1 Tax=Cavia porcellus TaxID=10141 RepID=UPI002FE1F0F0